MRIMLIAVGRMKPGPEQDLLQKYHKSLPWPLTIHEIDIRKSMSTPERIAAEGDALLDHCAKAGAVIALDERGTSLGSEAFAAKLSDWQDQARLPIACVIGGADGLDERVRKRADLLLSFGKQTWPHMLVRTMLIEQLFRAQSIMSGHPYHRV